MNNGDISGKNFSDLELVKIIPTLMWDGFEQSQRHGNPNVWWAEVQTIRGKTVTALRQHGRWD